MRFEPEPFPDLSQQKKGPETEQKEKEPSFDDIADYFEDQISMLRELSEKTEDSEEKRINNRDIAKFQGFIDILINPEDHDSKDFEPILDHLENSTLESNSDWYDDEGGHLPDKGSFGDEDKEAERKNREMERVLTERVYENKRVIGESPEPNLVEIKNDLMVIFKRMEGDMSGDTDIQKAIGGIEAGNYEWVLKVIEASIEEINKSKGDEYREFLIKRYGVRDKTLRKLRRARDFLSSQEMATSENTSER